MLWPKRLVCLRRRVARGKETLCFQKKNTFQDLKCGGSEGVKSLILRKKKTKAAQTMTWAESLLSRSGPINCFVTLLSEIRTYAASCLVASFKPFQTEVRILHRSPYMLQITGRQFLIEGSQCAEVRQELADVVVGEVLRKNGLSFRVHDTMKIKFT